MLMCEDKGRVAASGSTSDVSTCAEDSDTCAARKPGKARANDQ